MAPELKNKFQNFDYPRQATVYHLNIRKIHFKYTKPLGKSLYERSTSRKEYNGMLRINHYYKLRNGLALIVPMTHVLNNTAKVKKQRKHFQKFCYKSGHHEAIRK